MTVDEKDEKMREIRNELLEFKRSPLFEYRTENKYHPVVGQGDHDADLMFIGEAPGKNEAEQGIPFCGRSGKLLDELIEHIGLKRENVYITNVVKDRPPENRDPTREEIALYTPFLIRQIDIIEPKVIATLGRFAMDFVLENFDHSASSQKISSAHGTAIKCSTPSGTRFTLVPLYHPAVALYNPSKKEVLKADFEGLKKRI